MNKSQYLETSWNVMAQAQKPDFVFWRNGRVHLNQPGALVQSTTGSRAVVILDTPCCEVVWRVLATHCIRQFPLHFPSPRHGVPSHFNWTLLWNMVDFVWNVMAHAQKPDFVFRRNGRVHLNRWGASVQPTTGSRGVRISGSNAGYTMFRGSVKGTGYPLHSPVTPSLPLPAAPCAITFQMESRNFSRCWWQGKG